MKKKQNKPTIDHDFLNKLMELFEIKGWEIEDKLDNKNSLFNNFGELFSWLDKEERDLIYKLTKDYFVKIELESYPRILKELLSQFKINRSNINKIFITPIIQEGDIGKIKSSSVVTYLFKSVDLIYDLGDYKVSIIETLNISKSMINKINKNDQAVLLLVDDFIGSGETVLNCLSYIKKNFNIKEEKIVILTIAGMNTGIDAIRELGYNCIVYHELKKGITDNFNKNERRIYINMMKKISKRLKVNEKNLLGYSESEALISLVRTPNNTFPVFWFDKKHHVFKSPFPRY